MEEPEVPARKKGGAGKDDYQWQLFEEGEGHLMAVGSYHTHHEGNIRSPTVTLAGSTG